MNKPMTKQELLSYIEKTWDAAQREAWGERFCDKNCTWLDHHPECDKAEQPTQQEPLTDAQIGAVAADIWGSVLIAPQSYQAFARAIEAKLREKNNG